MEFFKVTFLNVDEPAQEIIIARLSEGNEWYGFEQKEDSLLAYGDVEQVDVHYFNWFEDYEYVTEVLEEINWNEKWERDFEPIILGDLVAVRADFHKPIPAVKNEIIVTPKMSFGTGHHATTQLMLEQMSKIDLTNKTVFDYGTGTGVLSIYAEQLGAAKIIANDIDPWSFENAQENVVRNNCERIEILLGEIGVIKENSFDCILANINLNVLRDSMEILIQKLRPQGHMLISGIMKQNQSDILDILSLYHVDNELFAKGEWLCLHIHHK